MEFESLSKCPEVIHLFESLEQNRLYVEKAQLQEVVEHIDELTFTIRNMQQELSQMRQRATGAEVPIVSEAQEAVSEAKSVLDRAKETIRDTATKAVRAGRDGGEKRVSIHTPRRPYPCPVGWFTENLP